MHSLEGVKSGGGLGGVIGKQNLIATTIIPSRG